MKLECECCLHTWQDGRNHHTPAAYWWTFPTGLEWPLCVRCCAIFRQNAADDPTLVPLRIRSIDVPVSP